MKIKPILIETAARLVLNKQLWTDAKILVTTTADMQISNEEKREKVLARLGLIFKTLGETMLEIALRLAVLWLKSKQV
jgi:hypothetical protein